jgi:tetratricopeptide (TPR) repeat protein
LSSLDQNQILDRLHAASSMMMQRRPGEAADLLTGLKAIAPDVAEVRRLLGLALRQLGDLAGAEFELRGAIALESTSATQEALASTLEAAGRRGEAEEAYRAALAIDPAFARAAVGLSGVLLSESRPAESLAVIAPFGARADADVHTLSAHAAALKTLRRFDEAIAVYRRAAQVAPRSAIAEHNLGAVLADREDFVEAEEAVRRAFAKGLDFPQTWLVFAHALQGQDRAEEAEQAYRQAISRGRDDAEAHADLAQLVWMRTERADAACEAIDAAIAAFPANMRLRAAKARVLEYAGDREGAYGVLADAIAQQGDDPALHVLASHIVAHKDPEHALVHAERAAALSPNAQDALTALCLANLAVGRAHDAATLAGALRERAPLDQHAVALQATAWRLMGDPRYGETCDYETMVRSWTIDTPTGWPSLEAFLGDLAVSLQRRHVLRAHPIGQSLRQGVQTQQRLDRSQDPVIQAFFQAIDGPIRRHIEAMGTGADPLRIRNTGGYRVEGSWSVRLRPDGYHADHLHAKGWLSSACYIALPKAVERGHEGWLKFGQPGVPTRPGLEPETFVKPEPGKLVLFPSYMWHGTVPFSGDEPRLTIAFDLLPA